MIRPPPQQIAATKPALRGPARSSQPPQIAAETPNATKNSVNIHPMLATFQSQVVVNSSCTRDMSGQALGAVSPIARDNGSQNTREAVSHADTQMNAKCRRRHQPAIEAGFGYRMRAIENSPRRRPTLRQRYQV